jgi:hypothetical protein
VGRGREVRHRRKLAGLGGGEDGRPLADRLRLAEAALPFEAGLAGLPLAGRAAFAFAFGAVFVFVVFVFDVMIFPFRFRLCAGAAELRGPDRQTEQ